MSNSSTQPSSTLRDSPMQSWKVWEDGKSTAIIAQCILPLDQITHKGSAGRIGVLGGSAVYTGAPYYAAMATLRTGADLATILCAAQAAVPIKSYSPELMVLPVYDADAIAVCQTEQETEKTIESIVQTVIPQLTRMHCLVVGPGLGRDPVVLQAVGRILAHARSLELPIVLDADALFGLPLYTKHLGGYAKLVLTPNAMEYKRMLVETEKTEPTIDKAWDQATILQKGAVDRILVQSEVAAECHEAGSVKRPGGIGDVLAGVTATLVAWDEMLRGPTKTDVAPRRLACCCWTACCLVKRSACVAFAKHHRAMSATHILDELGPVFRDMLDE